MTNIPWWIAHQPVEVPDIDVLPLLDDHGFVILFDLFVAGRWIGSRRTVEQCELALSHFIGVEIKDLAHEISTSC